MNEIIDLFGEELSKIIGKPLLACKGFLRLALNDDGLLEKLEKRTLNYQHFEYMLRNGLKRRLNNLKLSEIDKTIEKLLSSLKKQQAIFVMNS